MLAKLSITSSASRHALAAQLNTFLNSQSSDQDLTLREIERQIRILSASKTQMTPEALVAALCTNVSASNLERLDFSRLSNQEQNYLGYSNFTKLSEADWVRLILLCDTCITTAKDPLALLYSFAQRMLSDLSLNIEQRLNAYYFLKSRSQTITLSLQRNIVLEILNSNNSEAQSILLADPACTKEVFDGLSLVQITTILSAVIPWTAKNDKDSLTKVVSHFIALQNPEFTLALIHSGLNGTIKLETLKEALQSSRTFEGYPEFNVVFLEKNLDLLSNNQEQVIAQALTDIKIVGHSFPEKTTELFKLFVIPVLKAHSEHLFFTAQKIHDHHPELLSVFVKLTSALALNPETIDLLAKITLKIANDWQAVRTAEELIKLEEITKNIRGNFSRENYAKEYNDFISENHYTDSDESKQIFLESVLIPKRLEPIIKDMNQGQARAFQQGLLDLLTSQGVWDKIIENEENSFQFSNDLQKILRYSTVEFFNIVFRALWDQSTGNRKCSREAIHWLLDQPGFSNFGFIDFFYGQTSDKKIMLGISTNAVSRLKNIFQFNDLDIIKKVFERNSLLSDRPTYDRAIPVTEDKAAEIAEKYSTQNTYVPFPELNESLRAEPPAYPLFLALTTMYNYTDINPEFQNAILPLLTHPDFHIADYYEHASEAFKQLPQVKAAMQLQYFFHPETVKRFIGDDLSITNIEVIHHPETFFQALKYRHSDDLHQMTIAISTANFAKDELYEKARSLHKQIKKLPLAAKFSLNQDIRFAAFSLAHRICKDKSVKETNSAIKQVQRRVTSAVNIVLKGHTLTGKTVKIPFLSYILDQLIKHQGCRSENTPYRQAPFIWSVYVEAYITLKREPADNDRRFSPEKMTEVNKWLEDQILDGKKTKETLGLLPEPLLNAIFNCTYVEADIKELRAIGERLLVDTSSDDGDDDAESIQENVAVAAPTKPRRVSSLSFTQPRESFSDRRLSLVSTDSSTSLFSMEDFWAEARNPLRVDRSLTAYSGSMHFASAGPVAVGAPSASAVAVGKL